MDTNGYPDETELELIETSTMKHSDLLNYVHDRWKYKDWGWLES